MKMPDSHEAIQNPASLLSFGQDRSINKECTILIVEDNVSRFISIARVLGTLGITCEWKTSGYEVVEYANILPHIDLILMNILLPYEDGFYALQKIRSSGRFQGVPIIAMADDASIEQMKRARDSGFDGFLGNPLEPENFQNQIYNILRGDLVWELK
jgi:CheY-like chemotaxis protein